MEGAHPPDEWLISNLCERFNCLPSQLEEEDPKLIMDIAELRAYSEAQQALKQSDKPSDVPITPMIQRVWEIEHEIKRRRERARRS